MPKYAQGASAAFRCRSPHIKTVDDLSFTSRNHLGNINWWDVTPPKTDYWHAHEMLGRAYGFELLDFIHNQDKTDEASDHTLAFILAAITRKHHPNDGLPFGFFEVISEYLITGVTQR